MRHPERKQGGRQEERGRKMRWWHDAGRPCGEVISKMGERVSRGRGKIQAQQEQCITFREWFKRKAQTEGNGGE